MYICCISKSGGWSSIAQPVTYSDQQLYIVYMYMSMYMYWEPIILYICELCVLVCVCSYF